MLLNNVAIFCEATSMENGDDTRGSGSASDLCLACGLCCDGSLHSIGYLKAEEVETAISAGFGLVQNQERRFFPQPCAMFRSACCSVYQKWRPEVCGEYRCKLLKSFLSKKVSAPEALAIVARMRDHQKRLATFFAGKMPTIAMVREEVTRVQGLSILARRERAEFLMQAAAYDFLLQKYFRTPVREGGSAEYMKNCGD